MFFVSSSDVDESSCAVGWCAADQASRSQQFDMARAGWSGALAL